MPNRDGTDPFGTGQCPNRYPSGSRCPVGYCVCPNCGHIMAHTAGVPCSSVRCPNCGTLMVRGS